MRLALVLPLLLALGLGCGFLRGEGDDLPLDQGCEPILGVQSRTVRTVLGTATVQADIPPFARSLMLSARSEAGTWLFVERVLAPDGSVVASSSDWQSQTEFLSSALLILGEEANLNWPVRDIDPQLTGGEWTFELAVLSSSGQYLEDEPVQTTLFVNRDVDEGEGCISTRILMSPETAADPALDAAVRAAVQRWQEVYDQAGVQVQASFGVEEALPETLDHPYLGSDLYETLKSESADEELVMVVGESIAGASTGILGEAGGIPGSLAPARRAVVAVGWLLHAGADGSLDDTDTQGLGETMAHEIGHYVGLFHPVELDSSGRPSGYSDALSDTPDCDSSSDCLDALGTNLMYPYKTCYDANCARQDGITGQQGAVIRGYTGAR
jgi:hypothetical protein